MAFFHLAMQNYKYYFILPRKKKKKSQKYAFFLLFLTFCNKNILFIIKMIFAY